MMRQKVATTNRTTAGRGIAARSSAPTTRLAKVATFSPILTTSGRRPIPFTRGRAWQANSAAPPNGRFTAKRAGQLEIDRIAAPIAGPAEDDAATVTAFQPIAAPSW